MIFIIALIVLLIRIPLISNVNDDNDDNNDMNNHSNDNDNDDNMRLPRRPPPTDLLGRIPSWPTRLAGHLSNTASFVFYSITCLVRLSHYVNLQHVCNF